MSTKNYVTAREIVSIVLGDQFYTVREICDIAMQRYPEKIATADKVRFRLTNLSASPRAKVEQIKRDGESLNRFRLISVEEGYLVDSEARQTSSRQITRQKRAVVREPVTEQDRQEMRVIRIVNFFDSLIRPVRSMGCAA